MNHLDKKFEMLEVISFSYLQKEAENILAILRERFSVYVKGEEKEILKLLKKQVAKRCQDENIESTFSYLKKSCKNQNQKIKTKNKGGLVVFGTEEPPGGFALIKYELSGVSTQLTAVARMTSDLLKYLNMEIYLDAFDSKVLNRLKVLLNQKGFTVFMDAVVKIAYYGGFCADSPKISDYLDELEREQSKKIKIPIPINLCAQKFLSHVVVNVKDPHNFVKAALTYYMTFQNGVSVSRASRLLGVSRTTITEHLRRAEELGIIRFFAGQVEEVTS